MEITDLEVTAVSCPFEGVLDASTYDKGRRETVVVTVETDAGVTGHTYSMDFGDVGRRVLEAVVGFVRDDIRPRVVGDDLFAAERRWEDLFAETRRFPAWEADARRFFLHAIGAVDTALWDAIGKAAGQPLYELWGGYRDSLPIIAIGGYYSPDRTLDDLVAEMREYAEMGLAGVKCKVGKATVEEDLGRVAAIREAMGEDFVVMCDANQGWTADEAVAFAERAREYGIEWLEEPVVWHDQDRGMREVRRRTGVRVCAGQSELTAADCRRLIDADAVDVINFDASWGGGPTAWRPIASMARSRGVEMGHHEEPHLAMHLLASVPHGTYVECFHPDLDPVFYGMVGNTPRIKDGSLHLPDGPGLGLELDEGFIEEHAIEV